MPQETIKIVVKRGGDLNFIYTDRLRRLMHEGDATTKRASHVEPGDPSNGQNPLQWYADLTPSNGPVLGGFETRQEALGAEVEWLNINVVAAGV